MTCFFIYFQDENDGVVSRDDSVFSQTSCKQSLYVFECIELTLSANSEEEKSSEEVDKFPTETFANKDETYAVKLFKGYLKELLTFEFLPVLRQYYIISSCLFRQHCWKSLSLFSSSWRPHSYFTLAQKSSTVLQW